MKNFHSLQCISVFVLSTLLSVTTWAGGGWDGGTIVSYEFLRPYVLNQLKADLVTRLREISPQEMEERLETLPDSSLKKQLRGLALDNLESLIERIQDRRALYIDRAISEPDRYAETVTGATASPVFFDLKKIFNEYRQQNPIWIKEVLLGLAFHEHLRHFGIDDKNNEAQALVMFDLADLLEKLQSSGRDDKISTHFYGDCSSDYQNQMVVGVWKEVDGTDVSVIQAIPSVPGLFLEFSCTHPEKTLEVHCNVEESHKIVFLANYQRFVYTKWTIMGEQRPNISATGDNVSCEDPNLYLKRSFHMETEYRRMPSQIKVYYSLAQE